MSRLLKASQFAASAVRVCVIAGLTVAVTAARPLSGAETKPAANPPAKDKAGDKAGAAPAKTNAPPKVVVIPKAVFTDEIKVGKDPFFPNSIRRNPPPPTPPPNQVAVADNKPAPPPPPPPPPDPFKDFSLRGISGVATRKFASINTKVRTYVFKRGEKQEVKTPEGTVRLHCVDIKDESVIIAIEGKPGQKELPLRSGP